MRFRNIVLGSAAGLVAGGAAQAADLPVKAKAVEYVKVCSLYGAGFWYIPGSDTCMKLGGFLRADLNPNAGVHDGPLWSGDAGQGNRYKDNWFARSRFALTIDTRSATEYGVVRTFTQADFTFDTLGFSRNPNGLATNLGNNTNLLSSVGGGWVAVETTFLQFAGFTFGKSASAYSTPWHGFLGNNTAFLLGGHDTVSGVNNIQYSAQFGAGVSGTIGLDDPVVYDRTAVYNLATGLNATGTTGNAYAGVHAPDIVGNIRADQAWGMLQFSAAAHEVSASYNVLTASTAAPSALSEISGHPNTVWGGAVMAALQLKNLPTGPGDDFKIDASYAKGNTKNVISTASASPSFAMFGGTGRAGAYQSVGFGATSDAVYLPVASGGTGDLKLVESFGIRAAFNHNWDPNWSTSLFGSASAVRYGGSALDINTGKGQYCSVYNASTGVKSADYACNPDFNVYQIGLITRWTPVKNLTFSGEVMYSRLDQNFTGTNTLTPSAPKPATVYEYRDQSTVSMNLRAQKNF